MRQSRREQGDRYEPRDIEFGLDSFAIISVDEKGQELTGDVVIRDTVEDQPGGSVPGWSCHGRPQSLQRFTEPGMAPIPRFTLSG